MAPGFDYNRPTTEGYIQNYENVVEELHVLALNLMQILNPMAQEVHIGKEATGNTINASAASNLKSTPRASENEVIEQLQKYKGLMDAGIITEEEFTAKKRQLLGI